MINKLTKQEKKEAVEWRIKKCGSPYFEDLFKEFYDSMIWSGEIIKIERGVRKDGRTTK